MRSVQLTPTPIPNGSVGAGAQFQWMVRLMWMLGWNAGRELVGLERSRRDGRIQPSPQERASSELCGTKPSKRIYHDKSDSDSQDLTKQDATMIRDL